MVESSPAKRVFEVAREIKSPTQEILDFLTSIGYNVSRKQMHPVDEKMYIAILFKFDRPRFEKYLIEHGLSGEELMRTTALLEQKSKVAKPEPVTPISSPRLQRPHAPRIEQRVTRRVAMPEEPTNFRIYVKERPANPFIQLSTIPQKIPTDPLALDLIQRLLELPHEQKVLIVGELRKTT